MSRRIPRLSEAELFDRYVGQGQTQARIAADVGVDPTTVSAWLRDGGIPTRRRGGRPQWSATRREQVATAYEGGASIHALAAEYHVSHTTVRRYLHAAGVTLRPAGGSPQGSAELREQVATAYEEGASSGALAAEHGISPATVRRYLHAAGVTLRPSSAGNAGRVSRVVSAELRERLAAHYEGGASLRALAEEHHISYGAVRTHLLAAGVTLRGPGGPRPGPRGGPGRAAPGPWTPRGRAR